jgi:hypothetical protein
VIREPRGDIHRTMAEELEEGWGVVVSLGPRLQWRFEKVLVLVGGKESWLVKPCRRLSAITGLKADGDASTKILMRLMKRVGSDRAC